VAAFEDHFSTGSDGYRAHRPGYPDALFDFLAGSAPGRERAWDCACGSGQASVALARRFGAVIATDASAAQLACAAPASNIDYLCATAESAPLAAASVDAITVAQALHWFDLPRFYAEVVRVLRPGGLIAAWTYGLMSVEPALDARIARLYADLGPWWPAARRHVESGYATLPFPFDPLSAPALAMVARWRFADLLGYLGTWSARRLCQAQTGEDLLEAARADLEGAWGDPGRVREVRWPLALRAGRRPGISG